jgi:hypothetical protein
MNKMSNSPFDWLLIELSMLHAFFSDPPFAKFTSNASKKWLQDVTFDTHNKGTEFWTTVIQIYKEYKKDPLVIKVAGSSYVDRISEFLYETKSDWIKKYGSQFPNQRILIVFDEASVLLNNYLTR